MEKEVFSVNEIKDGEMKAVLIGFNSILISKIAGKFYAVDNLCSHLKIPLAIGELNGEVITCKAHGAQFNVCTGKMLEGPANAKWQEKSVINKIAAPVIPALFSGDVSCYPVTIKDEKVYIELPN